MPQPWLTARYPIPRQTESTPDTGDQVGAGLGCSELADLCGCGTDLKKREIRSESAIRRFASR